ncbi:MAG: hypothetical protein JWO98_174 [Frankiales bacterium]|nr:hypothetical protein [Frankiales bacterium]
MVYGHSPNLEDRVQGLPRAIGRIEHTIRPPRGGVLPRSLYDGLTERRINKAELFGIREDEEVNDVFVTMTNHGRRKTFALGSAGYPAVRHMLSVTNRRPMHPDDSRPASAPSCGRDKRQHHRQGSQRPRRAGRRRERHPRRSRPIHTYMPAVGGFDEETLARLRRVGAAELALRTELSSRRIRDVLTGRAKPRRSTQAKLLVVLGPEVEIDES